MNAPRLGIIVFARMSSQRLPGKVLMDFGGRPLLAHILARASALQLPMVVATSVGTDDDAVADLAETCGVPAFRGSLNDVLQRAIDCADAHGLDAFARLCGDRPYFMQDQMGDAVAAMASSFTEDNPADLFTNHLPFNPPPGLSTEVVRVAALRRAMRGVTTAQQREHLTSYLYDHADAFDIRCVESDFSATCGSTYAVDTASDLERLSAVANVVRDVHVLPADVATWLASPVPLDRAKFVP